MKNPAEGDTENQRLVLQQATELLKYQIGLLMQIVGFLAALNGLLFGYGLTQRKSIALLVGALVPILVWMIAGLALDHASPVVLAALRAERNLELGNEGVIHVYVRSRLPGLYKELADTADGQSELTPPPGNFTFKHMGRKSIVPILTTATAVQLLLFISSITIFNYPLM